MGQCGGRYSECTETGRRILGYVGEFVPGGEADNELLRWRLLEITPAKLASTAQVLEANIAKC